MSLRPIGRLIQAVAQGVLARQGRPPSMQWQPVLNDLIDQLRQRRDKQLVSIALRGSLARGTDVAGVSDLDLVVVLQEPTAQSGRLQSPYQPALQIETSQEVLDELLTSPHDHWMRFAMAFSGWTLWGRDLAAELPEPKLGLHCIAHLKAASHWLEDWQTYWTEEDDAIEHKAICQWLMKRITRSLFETQMLRLNAYSRDIYPCAMAAIDAFPRQSEAVHMAAELAVQPTSDRHIVQVVTNALSPLLLAEQERYATAEIGNKS